MTIGTIVNFLVPIIFAILGGGLLTSMPSMANQAPTTQTEFVSAPTLFPLREQVVLLAETDVRRYARTRLTLEVTTSSATASGATSRDAIDQLNGELRGQRPYIDEAIAKLLETKTTSDLASAAGQRTFKDEVRQRVNAVLGHDVIEGVVLSELVVQ